MRALHPYINLPGTSEEAFDFYKSVFGGEFCSVVRFGETPEAEKLSETDRDKIMHISLPLNCGTVLMATDIVESVGPHIVQGNNFSLSIDAETKEEADELYAKLSEGGKIIVPIHDAFWGSYFGMLTDRFGIQWMINFA